MNEIAPSIDSMLNADLSGVDTSFPVLEPGVIPAIIAKCYQDVSKEKKTPGLFFEFTTTQPQKTHSTNPADARTLPAGFTLRDTVWFTAPKQEGQTPMWKQRLAQIKEAVFGDKAGPFGDPAMYVGKPVVLRVKVDASEEFGNQNRVAAYVRLAH